jgi:hypothetical protein
MFVVSYYQMQPWNRFFLSLSFLKKSWNSISKLYFNTQYIQKCNKLKKY